MTDLIKLIFSLLVPILMGAAFVSLFNPKKDKFQFLELSALSFLIGTGILTLEMLLLGMLKVRLDLQNILVVSAVVTLIPIIINFKNIKPGIPMIGPVKFDLTLLEVSALLAILLRIVFVLYESLVKPVIGVDAFVQWSLRAKVFYMTSSLSLDPSKAYFAGGGGDQAFYPIHIPLLETWIFNVLGYWNDALVKIIFPFFFVSLLIIFYYSIVRCSSRLFALIAVYLLSSLPMLLHHSTLEYIDMPMAAYFASAFIFLLQYLDTEDKNYLFISGILAGIGTWAKSEGMPLVIVPVLVLVFSHLFYKRDLVRTAGDIGQYIVIVLIFKVPWSLFNMIYKIPKNEWQRIEYDKVFDNLPRIPVIFGQFYSKFFFYGNWNIAWFLVVVVLAFTVWKKRDKRYVYALATMFLTLFAFFMLYYLTPSYRWLLDGTTLNRNTLVMMPILVYFVSYNMYVILSGKAEVKNDRK